MPKTNAFMANRPLNSAFALLVCARPYVFPNHGFRERLREYERRVIVPPAADDE